MWRPFPSRLSDTHLHTCHPWNVPALTTTQKAYWSTLNRMPSNRVLKFEESHVGIPVSAHCPLCVK